MILIVDDNIEWCKSMNQYIKMLMPFEEIVECYKGLEAIRIYEMIKPGLVLMDIEMDDLDGLKATRTLKEKYPDSNVVILTQYDDKYLREEAASAGALGYITKDNLTPLKDILTNFSNSGNQTGL